MICRPFELGRGKHELNASTGSYNFKQIKKYVTNLCMNLNIKTIDVIVQPVIEIKLVVG